MQYYLELKPGRLPKGFSWLHPQPLPDVRRAMQCFFDKYFNDDRPRTLMLGINPGRHGAGITGVNFTAARQLTHPCGIEHPFGSASELSAEFIYELVMAYGGPDHFYRDIFIGSVCPLGFVKEGKNINYYDDKTLLRAVTPFIIKSMQQLVSYRVQRQRCVCIGGEKNYKHLAAWNEQYGWFDTIVALPHPRFIMQYRRKDKQHHIDQYLAALSA